MENEKIKLYREFSCQFWNNLLDESPGFFKNLPKKSSVNFSLWTNKGTEIRVKLVPIYEIWNVLMRLRIFHLKNSNKNVNKILNCLSRDYPESRLEINRIQENIKILENMKFSTWIKIGDIDYKSIRKVVDYIIHWVLLHDDDEKKKHYDKLFSPWDFIWPIIYMEIIDWILHYTRVLLDTDFLIRKSVLWEKITYKELYADFLLYLTFIDKPYS